MLKAIYVPTRGVSKIREFEDVEEIYEEKFHAFTTLSDEKLHDLKLSLTLTTYRDILNS